MEKIKLRQYRDEDFKAITDLLKRNLEFEDLSDQVIREKLYDDPSWNPEMALIAEYNGDISGFMLGVVRDVHDLRIGYIKLMAVEKSCRRKGLASEMYKVLEQTFRDMELDAIRMGDVPLNYLQPGVDLRYTAALEFAKSRGFKENGEAVNMRVDLGYSDWDSKEKIRSLETEQLDLRRAEKNDIKALKDFVTKYWKLWEFEVDMAMRNDPPTMFIARRNNQVLAFSAYDANNRGTGWFGPMGTDPELQGKGVGSVLLYMCLEDMKRKGLKESTIPWVGPTGFYKHHANARISRTFQRFEKRLNHD